MAGKAGRIMTRNAPEIIEVTSERFEELLQRADSNTLREEDMELMRHVFASYAGFFQIVGDKKTTIARLRKLMFGATSEKSKNVLRMYVSRLSRSRSMRMTASSTECPGPSPGTSPSEMIPLTALLT